MPLGSVFPLSFYAVFMTNVWLGWPFMMAIATGALQSIPRELYEAAEVDGASGWQSFWNITVPMIRPAMIPAIIIGMMMTFNQFNVIYFVSGGGPLHPTEILVTQAYRLVNETTVNLPGVGNVRPYGDRRVVRVHRLHRPGDDHAGHQPGLARDRIVSD